MEIRERRGEKEEDDGDEEGGRLGRRWVCMCGGGRVVPKRPEAWTGTRMTS